MGMTARISKRHPASAAALASAFWFACAAATSAGGLNFVIGNDLTLQQIDTSTIQSNYALGLDGYGNPLGSDASTTLIYQRGYGNAASTSIVGSSGATGASIQIGSENIAGQSISNSPGSVVAQFQLGDGNTSLVGISGGARDGVATVQVGNNHSIVFGLVNSTDTTVVIGQGTQSYNGGLIVKNAPPGTTIKIN